MCRGVPARVLRIEGELAWVAGDAGAGEVPVSLLGVEGIAEGDYVFHHAGLVLARVEPDEAAAILATLRELDALWAAEEARP